MPRVEATRREAVEALMDLWHEGHAEPDDLCACGDTVLELWREVLERVRPFQQDTDAREWVLDEEYDGLGHAAERMLAVMGQVPGKAAGEALRAAVDELKDPDLRMFALLAQIRRLDAVSPDDVEEIAADTIVRIHFWNFLQEMDMEALMPERWALPDALAESDLVRWLRHPNELNGFPERIEMMRAFPVDVGGGNTAPVFLFRFKPYVKGGAWSDEWLAGIAGPFRDGVSLGSPWSRFERWDAMSPTEHFERLREHDGCG